MISVWSTLVQGSPEARKCSYRGVEIWTRPNGSRLQLRYTGGELGLKIGGIRMPDDRCGNIMRWPNESTRRRLRVLLFGTMSAALFAGCSRAERGLASMTTDWPAYGGDAGGTAYSSLLQIDRSNVHRLEVTWTFSTHSPVERSGPPPFWLAPATRRRRPCATML